jgi:hypothetical protein
MRSYRLRDDDNDIAELLEGLKPQSARERYRHWGKHAAAKIVRECWPAVEKVAAALLEHGILTGDQVKEIINASVDARIVRP